MADLPLGRWLVEVGEDGYILQSRIGSDDKAHGGDGEDLRIPGVNAWLDEQRRRHPGYDPSWAPDTPSRTHGAGHPG